MKASRSTAAFYFVDKQPYICNRRVLLDRHVAKAGVRFFVDTMKKNSVLSVYGNVSILKGYCENCEGNSFIQDGLYACCGSKAPHCRPKIERVSDVIMSRKKPKKKEALKILKAQGFRCLYCGYRFGEIIYLNGYPVSVNLEWDHILPYSYSGNNSISNFCAACGICNGIKSDFIFDTLVKAQQYITRVRKEKGYSDAP